MVGLGLGRGPGLPYLGTFGETNVRLYSVDAAGRRAVVFRSLDASRLVPVLVAQALLRLPYKWSRMRLDERGGVLTYTCRRRFPGPRPAISALSVRVGAPIVAPPALDHFVRARGALPPGGGARTLHMPTQPPPWPLHRAELLSLDDSLVAAAGLPALTGPPV